MDDDDSIQITHVFIVAGFALGGWVASKLFKGRMTVEDNSASDPGWNRKKRENLDAEDLTRTRLLSCNNATYLGSSSPSHDRPKRRDRRYKNQPDRNRDQDREGRRNDRLAKSSVLVSREKMVTSSTASSQRILTRAEEVVRAARTESSGSSTAISPDAMPDFISPLLVKTGGNPTPTISCFASSADEAKGTTNRNAGGMESSCDEKGQHCPNKHLGSTEAALEEKHEPRPNPRSIEQRRGPTITTTTTIITHLKATSCVEEASPHTQGPLIETWNDGEERRSIVKKEHIVGSMEDEDENPSVGGMAMVEEQQHHHRPSTAMVHVGCQTTNENENDERHHHHHDGVTARKEDSGEGGEERGGGGVACGRVQQDGSTPTPRTTGDESELADRSTDSGTASLSAVPSVCGGWNTYNDQDVASPVWASDGAQDDQNMPVYALSEAQERYASLLTQIKDIKSEERRKAARRLVQKLKEIEQLEDVADAHHLDENQENRLEMKREVETQLKSLGLKWKTHEGSEEVTKVHPQCLRGNGYFDTASIGAPTFVSGVSIHADREAAQFDPSSYSHGYWAGNPYYFHDEASTVGLHKGWECGWSNSSQNAMAYDSYRNGSGNQGYELYAPYGGSSHAYGYGGYSHAQSSNNGLLYGSSTSGDDGVGQWHNGMYVPRKKWDGGKDGNSLSSPGSTLLYAST